MKRIRWISLALGIVALALAVGTRLSASSARRPLPVEAKPGDTAVRDLLYAVPFVLDEPYTHFWRTEQPMMSAGYLVVLAVDPEYVVARQTAEPVLYAGDQTVERINHGEESGRVIAIVPSERDEHGTLTLDLAATPFFFGAPDLPERVDAAMIAGQRAFAEQHGARAFDRATIEAALARGGAPLHIADRTLLDERAALLILEHSPAEFDLAQGLLAPRVK